MESTPEFTDSAAWIGRQQAFGVIASKCSASRAQCLKEIRERRVYEQLGLTWEEFCPQHAGMSRSNADRLIQQYEEFGEAYFRLSELARVSPETYRQIADNIDDETISLGGEEIALVPENGPRIRAAIDGLRRQLREERGRTEASLTELHLRSDALIDEVKRRVTLTLPNVLRDPLKAMALDAARRWTRIASAIDKLDQPRTPVEP